MFFGFYLLWVRSCGGAYALPVLLLNTVGSGFSWSRNVIYTRSVAIWATALLAIVRATPALPMLCLVTLGANTFWWQRHHKACVHLSIGSIGLLTPT